MCYFFGYLEYSYDYIGIFLLRWKLVLKYMVYIKVIRVIREGKVVSEGYVKNNE